jgi:hypothetical protein
MPKNRGGKKMNGNSQALVGWLYGWKDIGFYMGCDEKTSRANEKFNLPIYRDPKGKVRAHPRELDKWIKNCPFAKKR